MTGTRTQLPVCRCVCVTASVSLHAVSCMVAGDAGCVSHILDAAPQLQHAGVEFSVSSFEGHRRGNMHLLSFKGSIPAC